MKKGLFLVLFALVSVLSYSQVTWNVEAGMTMNNMSKVDKSKMKMGYTVGVGMDYAFTDMWSLQSGLKLVNKGFKIKEEESEEGYSWKEEATYNPLYLEIPILAAVKFQVSDNMKLVVNAGPYVALGLAGKGKLKSIEQEDGEPDYIWEGKANLFSDAKPSYKMNGKDWEDAEEKNAAIMNRFDLGLHFGVGLEINKFLVGLSGEFGFLKAAKYYDEKDMKDNMSYIGMFSEKYNESTNKSEKISPKNMSFAITVGYKF